MSDDKPKVVTLRGEPVQDMGATPAPILEGVEAMLSMLKGETHVAYGAFVVDHMGRVAVNFHVEPHKHYLAIGGATLLQHRLVVTLDKALTENR